MKSANLGQFHELIAKLLTRTDYSRMDSYEIQKLIKDPQITASFFVRFVNLAMRLHFNNLVIVDSSRRIEKETSIKVGDTLRFYLDAKTVKVVRKFPEGYGGYSVNFRVGEDKFDDKSMVEFEDPSDIHEACAMFGCFIDCKTIVEHDTQHEILTVKFEWF